MFCQGLIPLSRPDEPVSKQERRLAAIMFTDLVGYTALTQQDEALAMQVLEEHRRRVRPYFNKYNGREIKTIGDAFLVEFASALEATRCAFDIQRSMNDLNFSRPQGKQISLRVGIHLGDVIHDQNDVYGDAVNIASRIEPLASPGGICVSQQVYDQIKNKFEFPLSTLGEKKLKNVSEAVEVYLVVLPWNKKSDTEASLEWSRIAVLPFANLSPDPADEYFADGLTEELIDRLSQVRELQVIARTSIMSYKKKDKKVADIARELSVGSLVEGSIRKAGNRIRVTAQLIDGVTEAHLWSSHYDKNLDDIFEVQSEIAEKVAVELKAQLLESDKLTLEKKPTENTEAYTCFLRGRELFRDETERSVKQAMEFFEKAIDLDPRFARAYVGVAECHNWLANQGYEPHDASISIVKRFLEHGLALGPDLPEVHSSLSEMFYTEDNAPSAEAEARKALELNPSLPDAYDLLGELAALKGEPETMVRHTETAYRLDPIRPRFIWRLGVMYLNAGREQEALEHWRRTEALAPAFAYRGITEFYINKMDLENAKEFFAKAEKLEPTNPRVIWMGGVIAALGGDRQGALLSIRKIEEAHVGSIGFNFIAYVFHALGELTSYFDYINRALEGHALIPSVFMYSPLFTRARSDPRYAELVEKLRRQCGLHKYTPS